jgi:DNA-binding beta-propeller fold protein YncE
MFTLKASLAAALFLAVLLVPSASAQYIYVANAGEDTVSKIDINTNQEVAKYATWFTFGAHHIAHIGNPWAGAAPSRLLQDSTGNLYVLNRFFSTPNPSHLPVLLKIAPTGGTLGTTTSNGLVLPMVDANNNNHIDPGEATDMRIKWASEIGIAGTDEGALGRALCIDTSGVLWIGMFNTQRYYKVNPANGQMLGPPILTPGHRPYGCQVDTKGRLWSVDEGQTLAEIDTVTNQVTIHNHGTPTNFGSNYSVSLFNSCGSVPSKVYLSGRPAKTYIAYDPQTSSFSAAPLAVSALFTSFAIGVDLNGNIVSGEQAITGRVIKSTQSGTIVWDTNLLPAGPVVPAHDLHGIIIDEHNDIWAVHLRENRVVKYSGVDGHWIATVPVGDSPYTYGNPPPPTCPCAEISEHPIKCEGQSGGTATYS